MGYGMIFLLGCWLGCIAGFLLAGLASAGKSEEHALEYGLDREIPTLLPGVLAEEVGR